MFYVAGGQVHLFQPWAIIEKIAKDGRWTVEELERDAAKFAETPFELNTPSFG